MAKNNRYGARKKTRWPLIGAIVLGHIVGLYLLARALVPDLTDAMENDVVSALTVTVTSPQPEETPKPPDVEPKPDNGEQGAPAKKAVPAPDKQPQSTMDLKRGKPEPKATASGKADDSGARDGGEGSGAAGEGKGTGSGNAGSGQGNDLRPVTKPSVRSGELNTARDFPVPEGGRKMRFGKSVTVAFTVAKDGRSKNCSVLRSEVDAATSSLVCALVAQKIRFNPATNRAGEPVEARYGYRVDFRGR